MFLMSAPLKSLDSSGRKLDWRVKILAEEGI